MSTRCRTHQAESISTGGLDLHASDRFPPKARRPVSSPFWLSGLFIYATVRLDLHHSGRVTRFRDFDIESMRRSSSKASRAD
jgi:hypothetical protein